METALATRILAHPKVEGIEKAQINDWQDLGKVFVRAFDDKGQQFPIDFDEAWAWLAYARKDSALRTLKAQFIEGVDYTLSAGSSHLDVGVGSTPDKYFLTTNAFEDFAMAARTEAGKLVRSFFRAIRDAYMELATAQGQLTLSQEDALIMAYHKKDVLYIGEVQGSGENRQRLCKVGQTSDIAKQCKLHKQTFRGPYYFQLLHVAEVDDKHRAEGVFKKLPEVRQFIRRVHLGGLGKKELFSVPDSLTPRKLEFCLRRAARLSAPDNLQLADASGMTLLLQKGKTLQARLELEKAKLDHEWRMLTYSGTREVLSAVDAGQGAGEEIVEENSFDEAGTEEPVEDEMMDVEEEATVLLLPEDQVEAQAAVVQAPPPDDVERLIRSFIDEHCIVGDDQIVASLDFRDRLLAAVDEAHHDVLGSRRIGIVMHQIGFKAREVKVDRSRKRGFGGVSVKPLAD